MGWHLDNIIREEGVDGGQIRDAEVRQLAALVLGHLHRRARHVVRLAEGHTCARTAKLVNYCAMLARGECQPA